MLGILLPILGILLFFFIGRYYYKLAESYYKNKWLYGILGIAVHYFGTVVGGIIIRIAEELFGFRIDLSLSLIALPFGILFTYVVYFLLKRHWIKKVVPVEDEINDIGKMNEGDDDIKNIEA